MKKALLIIPLILFMTGCDQPYEFAGWSVARSPASFDECMLTAMRNQPVKGMYIHAEPYCKDKFPEAVSR